MSYDLPFRHRQALDPSGLDSIGACLHALQAAAKDCRNAGTPFETDPAVVLLAQHLGTIACRSFPDRAALRDLCAAELSELDRQPVLALLARRGVAYDEEAKRLFHSAARKALRDLAQHFALTPPDYDLRVNAGGIAVSGEVTLHSDLVYVQVSIGSYGGHEILYRSVRGRDDFCGGRNHFARIDALLEPTRFAARIAADLGLELPARDQLALVA
ncbi:hypothetical protein HJG53_13935 [Sphingomonas sp. ID1715]|uniref:hypothetical protein n=1 Tax=Sphingomonas sp. ID1715 TaxID=1656898 RepID=UPI0014892806|nr:hypothetical protein [Sphingomonas sp. ID1715]NNM78002.1 hypothetical protein [Sphingomonas sp. ID1715]